MKRCLDCGIRIAESSPNVLCEFCISLYRGVPVVRVKRSHWGLLAFGIAFILLAIFIGAFLYQAFQ